MTKSYYAIIPAKVRYDQTITANAKLLYGEITALCNQEGFCWASNSYFAELYGVSETSISKWISSLAKAGYLHIQDNQKSGNNRLIYLKEVFNKSSNPIEEKLKTPIEDKLKHNNTDINTTSNNKIDTKRFTPPTLEDVQSYIKEKSLNVNAKDFFDYYDVSGWVDAKGQKVKNWKQKLLTWNNRGFNNNGKPKQKETQRELIDRVVSGMGYKIEDKQDDVIDVEVDVGDIF